LRRYKHWFELAASEAGIKPFLWYCLRHMSANRLIMAKADVRTVAELMEHLQRRAY